MTLYKNPLYYEIAFSFINPKKQVNLFEKFIKKYSKIKVKRFLDLGCGPSLQLREIAKRGYQAIGMDSSPHMLNYLKKKAKKKNLKIETIKANLINFRLKRKVDFAFIMMGTISYARNNEEFLSHLDSVAKSLKKGGLYLIEDFTLDWVGLCKLQSWIMKRDGISVKTTYKIESRNMLSQEIEEKLKLEINDNGKILTIEEKDKRKIIFPQELLSLIKINNKFEFIGFFERYKLKPLKKANNNNIVLLRRK